MAGDPGGPAYADRGADRIGQDARRLSRGDRCPGAAGTRRPAAGRDPGRLRLAAEGALERHPAQPRSAARRDPRGAASPGPAGRARSAPGCAPATRRRPSASACAAARRTSSSPRRSRSTSCSARSPAAGCSATTRTVIVDEIHAVAPNKRGAHLALSLERLAELCGGALLRVGLSATQKPIEAVARFLVGARSETEPAGECTIIDTGHRRARDLALEVPSSPLEAVMSARRLAAGLRPSGRADRGASHHADLRQHAPDGRAGDARTVGAPGRARR